MLNTRRSGWSDTQERRAYGIHGCVRVSLDPRAGDIAEISARYDLTLIRIKDMIKKPADKT